MNFFRDFKSQKRGVSGVVTAVLLILLVIAAVGILWVAVQNFVQEGAGGIEGQAECFDTSFELVSADISDGSITVRRSSGDATLTEIRISDGTDTELGDVANPAVGETSTATGFTIVVGSVDVSVSYDIGDTSCALESLGSVIAVA